MILGSWNRSTLHFHYLLYEKQTRNETPRKKKKMTKQMLKTQSPSMDSRVKAKINDHINRMYRMFIYVFLKSKLLSIYTKKKFKTVQRFRVC